jgi:hypothetical protein
MNGDQDKPAFKDVKFRLNQYRPIQDMGRLIKNRHMAWPYRLLLGLPTTLLSDVLLPGRIFPWGDYYNPFTNTVHIYSDHPAVVLHEAGHAHDFAHRKYKGTYAALRMLPFVDLYQEFQASDEAIDHFIQTGHRREELRAYKILYPAYGTYAGQYVFFPFGFVIVIFGHIYGRLTAKERAEHYEELDAMTGGQPLAVPNTPSAAPTPVPAAP